MKKHMLTILAAIMLLPASLFSQAPASVTVMSYNIRVSSANDGTNSWIYRYPGSAMMILDQMPDVVGLQEALFSQVAYLKDYVKGYKVVAVGKDRGETKSEHMTMLYNAKTTSVVKWETFWLSETPDKAGKGWDAAYERSATWALCKDKKSGSKYYVVNTHLDNEGAEARREGLALIMSKMAKINDEGLPMVVLGDFNMSVSDPAMASVKAAMSDAREAAVASDSMHSFHGWGKSKETIDHIFFSGFSSCTEFQTVVKPYFDRKFISDHYPVKATLFF